MLPSPVHFTETAEELPAIQNCDLCAPEMPAAEVHELESHKLAVMTSGFDAATFKVSSEI
ncbi:hypothetical protein JY96_10300 [Aquabacterium sp. NJ1]|nr:hypothetical protein JY96_10300 [Aquabacterium sp. NJ1]